MKTLALGEAQPKQQEFFRARRRYIAYGGARGGGKSWAARTKAILLGFAYHGLQMLLLRRTLPELRENHVIPLIQTLKGFAVYRDSTKEFIFPTGSRLKLGYCDSEKDVLQYQGQAYDVIFMEEATQFTEFQYTTLTESSRPSGMCKEKFTPRMYFTCNPGGVGHMWVKRLFIDRAYRLSECEEDYEFIPAKVYDNKFLVDDDPEYVRKLENIPDPARREAMLNGNWDIFIGQYFTEFNREIHVIQPVLLPEHWRRYVSIDYGLDMLACYWIAMDEHENAYVYKEIYESGLKVSDAAKRINEMTSEIISVYYAPPDLWNRHSDTGKSTAEIFSENGIPLVKTSNDRVQGWYNLHEWLKPYEDEQGKRTAHLKIFENCINLARTLPALQFDEKNPNDCAKEPHELTHAPDALRYFVAGRPMPTRAEIKEGLSYEDQLDDLFGFGR